MASERRTEVKTKAATGPPVIAGGYAVPDEAVFVKRWRTEVVTRDMLVFPHGEGAFLLPGFSLRHTMTRQIERRMK